MNLLVKIRYYWWLIHIHIIPHFLCGLPYLPCPLEDSRPVGHVKDRLRVCRRGGRRVCQRPVKRSPAALVSWGASCQPVVTWLLLLRVNHRPLRHTACQVDVFEYKWHEQLTRMKPLGKVCFSLSMLDFSTWQVCYCCCLLFLLITIESNQPKLTISTGCCCGSLVGRFAFSCVVVCWPGHSQNGRAQSNSPLRCFFVQFLA